MSWLRLASGAVQVSYHNEEFQTARSDFALKTPKVSHKSIKFNLWGNTSVELRLKSVRGVPLYLKKPFNIFV